MNTINPFSALTDLGGAADSRTSVASDLDTFLTLLTTQLKNQNPLEPLDTNQFTQQLVQYSEVEQAIQTNQHLENQLQLQAASVITNAVSYIGKTVELSGTTQPLSNGSASWPVEAASATDNATFTIKDADGNLVFTESGPLVAGANTYQWDGENLNGGTALDGEYTLEITATDANGAAISVGIASSGLVEGVDTTDNGIKLLVGGREVDISEVTTVKL